VSQTLPEMTISSPQPDGSPGWYARLWRSWLKWVAVALACLWLADAGISLLIRHTTLKNRLTARLEAAFGRPVQVGSYGFSLWTGPELEAYSVRVGEDPRFGYEYFLRADSMTLRVRLSSFLLGHLELGTIALSHPSLNLVRNANGDWNLAEWLPRPESPGDSSANSGIGGAAKPAVPRFYKIEVNGGRINFKKGSEKLPFALVDVNGTAETEGPGRWRLDLVAAPERAAVVVQEPGTLHLAGHLGGTSSRLRPAVLQVDWSGASIPDVMRLVADRDYGVRGTLAITILARTEGDSWILQTKALLSQLHRWDLPMRDDNPYVSISASGRLEASGSRFELKSAKIEMPHSSAMLKGALDWTHPGPALGEVSLSRPRIIRGSHLSTADFSAASRGTELHITSKTVSLNDLFDWARAFHAGIADGVALGGLATLDANLGGWPPRLQDAGFGIARGAMVGTGIPSVRFGAVAVHYDARWGITLAPATITIGAPPNSFVADGSAEPKTRTFSLRVRGATSDVRELVAVADKLGWNLARGWNIAGPARCDLRWQKTGLALQTTLTGSVEWGTPSGGVSVGAPFLNRPVEDVRARAELQASQTHVRLSSARAFGTRWSGTLEHRLADGWTFSVSGGSLSAAELDRWLDARWRESFLDRMLPFLNSRAPASEALDSLHASGTIALDDFTLAPVALHHLRGDLSLDGRALQLTKASAQFGGGQLSGALQASLSRTPKYEAALDFSGIDLPALATEFPSLTGRLMGSASAKVQLSFRGLIRSDLLNSLKCRGDAVAKELAVAHLTVGEPGTDAKAPYGPVDATTFPHASARFSCSAGKIEFEDLALSGAGALWNGAGSVNFARNLDIRLRRAAVDSAAARESKLGQIDDHAPSADGAGVEYRITGTLMSPVVSHIAIPARPARTAR